MDESLASDVQKSIASAQQQFDAISVNLERLSQSKEVDPKDYVRAKTLISVASVSASRVDKLLKHNVGIDEEEVILEQLEMIHETLDNCREWGLL